MDDKIIPLDEIPSLPGVLSNLGTTKAQRMLDFGEFVAMEQTLEDAVDDMLALEQLWAKAA